MRIDSSGRLLINHTADTAPAGYASKLQLCDTSYQGSSMLLRRDVNSASSPTLLFAKTRSSSKGGSTVVQDGDNTGAIMFFGGDGSDADAQTAYILSSVDGTPGNNDMPGRLTFHTTADGATASTERVRIDSSGNLGIGNDASFPIFTDDRSLILGAGSGSVGLQLYSSTTGYNGIYFGDANTGSGRYRGYVEYKHNDDWLRFAVNGQERVRIDSSGRMGVGTNNPAIKLHVVDSVSTPIRLQNTGGGSVYSQYVNNDNARGYVGYEGKRLAFYADNGSNTGDTRVAFMDADGLKFFNDTAQTNALDDYEEGSWTPTFKINGSETGVTYGNRAGGYIKVGKLVTVWGRLTLTNNGTSTGQASIDNLPFTVGDVVGTTSIDGGGHMTYQTNTSGIYGPIVLGAIQGTQNAQFYASTNTNGNMVVDVTQSNLNNNFDCRFTLSYSAA